MQHSAATAGSTLVAAGSGVPCLGPAPMSGSAFPQDHLVVRHKSAWRGPVEGVIPKPAAGEPEDLVTNGLESASMRMSPEPADLGTCSRPRTGPWRTERWRACIQTPWSSLSGYAPQRTDFPAVRAGGRTEIPLPAHGPVGPVAETQERHIRKAGADGLIRAHDDSLTEPLVRELVKRDERQHPDFRGGWAIT